jgi:methanethiol S-methyltransferase
MTDQYFLLGLGWLGWCVLHSLLITTSVTHFLKQLPENVSRYSRLGYNIIAISTLLLLVLYTQSLPQERVFAWQDGWVVLQLCLLGASFVILYSGARHYDMGYFLGLKQISSRKSHVLLTEDANFTRDGIFAFIRHPWYLGSIILLWSALPVYYISTTLAVVILSLYLVVGTILEEHKLVAEFGENYRAYQREVSMFIPWKWLNNWIAKNHKVSRRK